MALHPALSLRLVARPTFEAGIDSAWFETGDKT
jgi:hypothetical protein